MDMQRKWAIIFALLIVIGVIAVMVPDSVLAMWSVDAEEAGWEGAEYYCEGSGGATISDTDGSGEEGWDTYYECNDGSYGTFSWNCPSCVLEP